MRLYRNEEEYEFINGLVQKRNIKALRNLRDTFNRRSWEGREMSIDPDRLWDFLIRAIRQVEWELRTENSNGNGHDLQRNLRNPDVLCGH